MKINNNYLKFVRAFQILINIFPVYVNLLSLSEISLGQHLGNKKYFKFVKDDYFLHRFLLTI